MSLKNSNDTIGKFVVVFVKEALLVKHRIQHTILGKARL
jgi:hypothetical protein